MAEKLEKMLPEGFISVDQFLGLYHSRVKNQEPVSVEISDSFNAIRNYVSSNGEGISQRYLDMIDLISDLVASREFYI